MCAPVSTIRLGAPPVRPSPPLDWEPPQRQGPYLWYVSLCPRARPLSRGRPLLPWVPSPGSASTWWRDGGKSGLLLGPHEPYLWKEGVGRGHLDL